MSEGKVPEMVTLWFDVRGRCSVEMEVYGDEPATYFHESALSAPREENGRLMKGMGRLRADVTDHCACEGANQCWWCGALEVIDAALGGKEGGGS